MNRLRIFISSVQKELTDERKALRDFLQGDDFLRLLVDVFLFEDLPAADRRADHVYLDEVRRCDIYLGLFGNEYGFEDNDGLSPTHQEFNEATFLNKYRLVFVIGDSDDHRHRKMRDLIREASNELIRRRVSSTESLISNVYSALVNYLREQGFIRTSPFDASSCEKATVDDLDEERMEQFIARSRRARNFPLLPSVSPDELLTHLNLFVNGALTHAAILLFGKKPQRFLISSELKCAHFHGTQVAKPIPSYQVYKGTVFELVDQAVDFVMSKIDLNVGTRSEGPQAPVQYEIPREVVAEAIVNAVAHRDYSSNGSVQVMLFADRLEVTNPGSLPASLTIARLRGPHSSIPANPLLAEPMYLAQYIERMGTGTGDMIRLCRTVGLPEPQFAQREDAFVTTVLRSTKGGTGVVTTEVTTEVAIEVTTEVERILLVLNGAMRRAEIQQVLGLKNEAYFRQAYILPALEAGYIEMTIPDKPTSRMQRYRLTSQGVQHAAKLRTGTKL